MTDTNLQTIKLAVLGASMYYREPIPKEVLQMYADELSDLPSQQVVEAYERLRKNPQIKKMPLPSEVRDQLSPVLSDLDQARLSVSNIISAISKVGPYQLPTLGQVEEEVIARLGGWQTLCEEITNENLPIMQAQMRDLALSVIKASRSGVLRTPSQLPGPFQSKSKGEALQGASHWLPTPLRSEDER